MLPPLFVLFAWPLVSIVFFKRLSLPMAIMMTIVGGYLLLPENTLINPPFLPTLDKNSIPALTALFLAFLFRKDAAQGPEIRGALPKGRLPLLLFGLLIGGAFMTVMTNPDPQAYELRYLPGLRPYDAFSTILSALMVILPLLLARRFLADPQSHRLLLQVLCIAALAYSLLVLFEVRMSPQLNSWIYGFFPHGWRQHIRGGGFRPIVFLQHGLLVGIFLSGAILAAVGLSRVDAGRRGPYLMAVIWLLITLLLSKNLGAVFITVALLPIAIFLNARSQVLAAAIIAGIFLSYPVMRTADILPYERILALAERIDPQRAGSLLTRMENEERMLDKVAQRPLFGWGGWGRSRVFDEKGNDITIADGSWIISMGINGWTGYVARFGLLTIPIFLLLIHQRRYKIGMETSVLTLVLAGNLIDMVPNSSSTPLTWLIAGALWGRLELKAAEAAHDTSLLPSKSRPGYRRERPPPDPVEAPTAAALRPKRAFSRPKAPAQRAKTSLK